MSRSHRAAASTLVALTLTALAAGCSSSSGPSPQSPATSAATTVTPTTSAAPAAAAGKDACTLVTAAMVKQAFGIDVSDGVAAAGATGGTQCTFKGTSPAATIIVQTSDSPDMYSPASLYSTQNSPVQVPGTDRGFVATPDSGNSHALIVKNGFGVDITLYVQGSVLTVDKEQALAAAITAQL